MNQLNAGAGGGSWQPDQRPASIARRMREGGGPCDGRRDGARITTEGHDLQRLTEVDEGGNECGCITADSGSRRTEGAAIEPDSKTLSEIQNSRFTIQTPVSYTHLTLPTSDLV